ncbi:MAG TPA: IMP dehydrogenase [Kiritimatiellia bacterium]|nr:IMP dehydrogenase [Kiritimatiellia bacterium]HRZ12246.1 IMP dehydrogenase [Kiritimatiellia bacterium]HSA17996.1 IMP dehydrogenase [Kiritimatiellia bacterium]
MSRNPHLDSFMAAFPREGLTFDDVCLVTRYADFLPTDTDLSAPFSARIRLNIPFASAAMDTVTEARMAIAMAMLGGIGIIHRNLSVEEQARIVRTVKGHLNGLIAQPVTFRVTDTLRTVRETRQARGYAFSGFPILDENDRLAGILTSADIKFARDPDAPVADIMTRRVITAPAGTTLQQAYDLMQREKIGKLPLVESGRLVGLYSYTDVRTLIEKAEPQFNRDAQHRLRVGAAIAPGDRERVERLAEHGADAVVIDTAHGHSQAVLEMVRWVKAGFPALDVVAGNIATGEAARALQDAGADAVKVGIGPGSICTTRVVTGVGVPQLTAIYECARAVEGRIPVIADGGIRHSGDVPKAIAAGADTVMMGSVLAGTEESPGEKILYQGRQYVGYRGMGSLGAMQAGQGSRKRYSQEHVNPDDLVPQGIEGMVPYAGTVQKVLTQYAGGLRLALGYAGCRSLRELQERGEFIRVTPAGAAEGHAHDVTITKEAPNYRT